MWPWPSGAGVSKQMKRRALRERRMREWVNTSGGTWTVNLYIFKYSYSLFYTKSEIYLNSSLVNFGNSILKFYLGLDLLTLKCF